VLLLAVFCTFVHIFKWQYFCAANLQKSREIIGIKLKMPLVYSGVAFGHSAISKRYCFAAAPPINLDFYTL